MRRRPALLTLTPLVAALAVAALGPAPTAGAATPAGVAASAATAVARTTVAAQQTAPVGVAPAAGGRVHGRVAFRWRTAAGRTKHTLELSPRPSFAGALTVHVTGTHRTLLLDSGTWSWRVRGTDGTDTPWSATRTVRVTAPAGSRVDAPRAVAPAATRVRTADPRFTWKAVSGRTRYDLRLSRRTAMTAATTWTTAGRARTVRLARGTWFWQVRADGDGRHLNGRWSTPRRLVVDPRTDVYAPSRPGALSVQAVGSTSVTVAYGAAHDDAGRVSYEVLADGRRVGTSRATEGVVVPLRCGTTATLTARAVDAAGNRSAASPAAHVRTRSCMDTTAPAAPAGLTVTATTETTVAVRWTAAVDPGHGVVAQYVALRDGSVVGGVTGTSYTFTGLGPAERHVLAIRARDGVGNLSTAAASVTATTALPPQATGDVRTYLLASDGASFQDAQRHYRSLSQVYPTFFDVDASGAVVGSGQPTTTRWLQIRGVKVMPRFHTEDAGVIEAIATDPARRDRLVDDVTDVVTAGGYDGANLDFEMTMPAAGVDGLTKQQRWDRLRNGYSAFVEELAARLHAQGHLLSVAVAVDWCNTTNPLTRETVYCASSTHSSALQRPRPYLYDYRRLAQASDELWLLAWGLHWATSNPGPVADTAWLTGVRSYYADLFADRPDLMHRLTLGTQLYGFDWSYTVVGQVDLTMPGGALPPAPRCDAASAVLARPRYSYTGSPTAGTLHVDWLCNTRVATPDEFDGMQALLVSLGATPHQDAAGEQTFSVPDPDVPGAVREGWYADAASVAARARLSDAVGWRVGLWRLGHEDQSMWGSADLLRGQS